MFLKWIFNFVVGLLMFPLILLPSTYLMYKFSEFIVYGERKKVNVTLLLIIVISVAILSLIITLQ